MGVALLVIMAVVLFFYYDRHNALSSVFRSWGLIGDVIAILVMAVICITPLPSEGLLVLYLKIFGTWWGVTYGWLGAVLSSVVVFFVARHLGTPILRSAITPARFHQVDTWVQKRGVAGLLFARLLPIPGFLISYILGTIPSIGLWSYVWTAAVSIIPYYVGSALIYIGIASHLFTWLVIGVIALLLFWLLGYMVKKRWSRK